MKAGGELRDQMWGVAEVTGPGEVEELVQEQAQLQEQPHRGFALSSSIARQGLQWSVSLEGGPGG